MGDLEAIPMVPYVTIRDFVLAFVYKHKIHFTASDSSKLRDTRVIVAISNDWR